MLPLADLLSLQAGVVSRRQMLDLDYQPHEIRSMLRRRELTVIFPGVMVNHTGRPTWLQRAWGAVLWGWPAALCGESAIRADERDRLHDTTDMPVQIAIDRDRKRQPPDGIDLTRRVRLAGCAQWNRSPPRLRYDEATVDLAADAPDDLRAVALLARACASRRTTATRLVETIERRPRLTRRTWMLAVLRDIADGTHSVLEHGYLRGVERAHGLPKGKRQRVAKSGARRTYRDVEHGLVVIELDGKVYHEGLEQRDRDLERDLDVLTQERTTIRLGWGQVFRRPCGTALKVATVLQHHGWTGKPRPCTSPDCAVRSIGATEEH